MQPCLCSSDSSRLDKDVGCSLCCGEQLGTSGNWTKPHAHSQRAALCWCGRQSLWERVISLSVWFMGQLLFLSLFHGRVGGIEAVLWLELCIPTLSLGLLNPPEPHSLHLCFCSIVIYFIDPNEGAICVIPAGWTPCLSRFMGCAFNENPFPVKSLTRLAVILLNNCQPHSDDRI